MRKTLTMTYTSGCFWELFEEDREWWQEIGKVCHYNMAKYYEIGQVEMDDEMDVVISDKELPQSFKCRLVYSPSRSFDRTSPHNWDFSIQGWRERRYVQEQLLPRAKRVLLSLLGVKYHKDEYGQAIEPARKRFYFWVQLRK